MQDPRNPIGLFQEASKLVDLIIKPLFKSNIAFAKLLSEATGKNIINETLFRWTNGRTRVSKEDFNTFIDVISTFGDGEINVALILDILSSRYNFQSEPPEVIFFNELRAATNPHGTRVFDGWNLEKFVYWMAGDVVLTHEDEVIMARVFGLNADEIFTPGGEPPKLPEPRKKQAKGPSQWDPRTGKSIKPKRAAA